MRLAAIAVAAVLAAPALAWERGWDYAPGVSSADLADRVGAPLASSAVTERGGRKVVTSWWRVAGVGYRCVDYVYTDLGRTDGWCERARRRPPAPRL